MDKDCAICGTNFRVKPSHFARRKCCSTKCMGEYRSKFMLGPDNPTYNSVEKICMVCNRQFYVKISWAETSKYCSRPCKHKGQSAIISGENNPNHRPHITRNKTCPICNNVFNRGYANGLKEKRFCSNKCYGKSVSGPLSSSWKGGATSEAELERNSKEYKEWRRAVFERDKFTCVDCGVISGKLQAHHILPFSKHKELRTDVANGKTVCIPCHAKYHPNLINIFDNDSESNSRSSNRQRR